jgi:ankyrin repeat protein
VLSLLLSLLLVASPLVDAVKQGNAAAVRALLQKRVDVNAPEGDGATALHWAVYADNRELVDLLIAAGANVNVANDLAITPLHLAGANGSAVIVGKLLDKGANPNALSETGVTPLMEAARGGNVAAVQALVQRGADVNAKERDRHQTALMWAVSRRQPAIVKVLLDHRADVHARSKTRPLTVMLDQGPRRAVKTAMQDARQIETGGSTALLFAAQVGDVESAKLLLGAGANADDTAADGNSAMTLAAFQGHSDVARVLLDAGAKTDAAGAGYTALHAAALRGDVSTVKALLAKGANPNLPLTKGSPVRRFGSQWALPTPMTGATPLFVAATYLEVEIVRALLEAGADHRVGIASGITPFLAAAGVPVEKETRPSDLVRWNVVDNDTPQVPRDEAEVFAATRLLLDAGADVNQSADNGDTALHVSAAAGMTTVIQLLADRGAKLDATNKAGQTPLAATMPKGRPFGGEPAALGRLKAAEELLRKLGATR